MCIFPAGLLALFDQSEVVGEVCTHAKHQPWAITIRSPCTLGCIRRFVGRPRTLWPALASTMPPNLAPTPSPCTPCSDSVAPCLPKRGENSILIRGENSILLLNKPRIVKRNRLLDNNRLLNKPRLLNINSFQEKNRLLDLILILNKPGIQ